MVSPEPGSMPALLVAQLVEMKRGACRRRHGCLRISNDDFMLTLKVRRHSRELLGIFSGLALGLQGEDEVIRVSFMHIIYTTTNVRNI